MKNVLIAILFMAVISINAQDSTSAQAPEMNNQLDSLSYFLGLSLGFDFQNLPFEANPDLILELNNDKTVAETERTAAVDFCVPSTHAW